MTGATIGLMKFLVETHSAEMRASSQQTNAHIGDLARDLRAEIHQQTVDLRSELRDLRGDINELGKKK